MHSSIVFLLFYFSVDCKLCVEGSSASFIVMVLLTYHMPLSPHVTATYLYSVILHMFTPLFSLI